MFDTSFEGTQQSPLLLGVIRVREFTIGVRDICPDSVIDYRGNGSP